MKSSDRNRLASLTFLLRFSIFIAGLHACACVTYHLKTERCKGNELNNKCPGQRVARINGNDSLAKVKELIDPGEKYWTGLSWKKNKGYFWDQTEDNPANIDSMIAPISVNTGQWHCFLVEDSKSTLEPKECNKPERNKYICEEETLQSSTSVFTETKAVSTLPETTMTTEQASPTNSGLTTSNTRKETVATTLLQTTTGTLATATISTSATTTAVAAAVITTTITTVAATTTETASTTTKTTMATALSSTTPTTTVPATVTTTAETVTTTTATATTTKTTMVTTAPATVTTTAETITTTTATATTTKTTMTTTAPATITTTATVKSSGLITLSLTSTLNANTVWPSAVFTTAMIDVNETLASTTAGVQTFISEASEREKRLSAKHKFHRFIDAIKAINATRKGSLQNAANATSNFFKDLQNVQSIDINVLLATQELGSFVTKYAKIHYKAKERKVISKPHYAMKIQKVPRHDMNAAVFSVNETEYSVKEGWASISIPSKTFGGKDAVVVFVVYNDIKRWLPDEKHVVLDGKTSTSLKLGSRIISGRVYPTPIGILEENVTVSFSYNNETRTYDVPHCLFWNFSIKSELNGSWSSKGCSLVKIVNNEITCSCNHLTNFAVLMQVGESKEVSTDHRVALEMITYIGCGLSLIGEVLTILIYSILMNLKQEQIQIRFNLVVAIAMAQIAFLSGIDALETKDVCVFVAALIHYFYLVGFAWMLFEGIYLYMMVIKVFNTVIRIRLFYVIAWGVPVLIVVLSIVIASSQDGGVQSYVHGDFCWVSFTNNLVWTFVTPVLLVCLINAVILGFVVHEILNMQSAKVSELERIRQGAEACVVLFPLLGMTWVFGILSVTNAGLVFQYIFTILNSLQGFFIFILHVLRNGDVRAEFNRQRQKWKEMRSITSSRTTHQRSTDIWTDEATKSDKYELNNTPNEATFRKASGYDKPPFLHQQRSMTPVDT